MGTPRKSANSVRFLESQLPSKTFATGCYAGFAEGLETADLREARALLDDLA